MRILIAPDSFKGTASARDVARSLARGWARGRPSDAVDVVPMADGGEGTIDAFADAYPSARRHPIEVTGPDGRPVRADWLELPDSRAVVELASTSGITLLDHLRPDTAHTRGFGQAIVAALASDPAGLVLAIGGSASTDGGLGLLVELGARATDASGAQIEPSGRGLDDLASIDLSGLPPLPPDGVTVVTDVTAPLLGPSGAAAVFGPQKGVVPARVPVHEGRLARWADALPEVDRDSPGAGAAGGSGFGLLAWGASLVPGSPAVASALGLSDRMTTTDLVITGEGRFDAQTAFGKVPSHLLSLARPLGLPVILVAGAISAETAGFREAVSLTDLAGNADRAMSETLSLLEEAGALLAGRL